MKMNINWKLFVARRIYASHDGEKKVSKPAIRIAMAGIAIGLAVMIVSVAVVIGFKHQVRDKVTGMGADILITNIEGTQILQAKPIVASDSMMAALAALPQVKHIQRYSVKPGMIRTDTDFQGMMLKGVGAEYDLTYLKKHLLEGEMPEFSDAKSSNKVLVSKSLANKLKLALGDKVYTYYIEEQVRARRFEIAGIYQTNFSYFDDLFLIGDLHTVNRLNQWDADEVVGLEVEVKHYDQLDEANGHIRELVLNHTDEKDNIWCSRTVEEVYPQIFAWLELLDINVWVILILMVGVAGFTMISGLLIIILERTNMIGVLKAVGADNHSIRHIFLTFSVYLIGRGMVIGNVIGLLACGIQYYWKPIKLDPATYYINAVPVELDIPLYLLLNVATLVVAVAMLLGPSYLISKIHPARSIRFE